MADDSNVRMNDPLIVLIECIKFRFISLRHVFVYLRIRVETLTPKRIPQHIILIVSCIRTLRQTRNALNISYRTSKNYTPTLYIILRVFCPSKNIF